VLIVTIWELGEATGPLFLAPLSELCGRFVVYNVANCLFIIGTIISTLSQSINFLIFARFATGYTVAADVLNPAIIGDTFSRSREVLQRQRLCWLL
jgi:MFS family permease